MDPVAIDMLGNELHKKVFIMKNIKLLTLNEIAIELNYSLSYISKIHSKALKKYKILIKETVKQI